MVFLAVTTGLRRSELFALKWSDLDFRERADGMDQLDRFGSTAIPKSLRILRFD
jgi:integrase